MRIQHNIMAMSAYRNYTNNVSAMKKNLEKLSSGYKINRAGDDAAGLAISEKMRAQITGLETAQKNAKDGISLVQTAEGALTEVHDMLNRMVELATQSANGTYDNTTDRNQLQKELDQLRSEINRIADSSNFNGIKLLDGSMSSKGSQGLTTKLDASLLPEVGSALGSNTIVHGTANGSGGSEFSVDFHGFSFSNGSDTTYTLKAGDFELTFQGVATGSAAKASITGAQVIADLMKGMGSSASGTNFKLTGVKFMGATVAASKVNASGGKLLVTTASKGDIKLSVGSGGENRLTFKQVNAPTTKEQIWRPQSGAHLSAKVGNDSKDYDIHPHTLDGDFMVETLSAGPTVYANANVSFGNVTISEGSAATFSKSGSVATAAIASATTTVAGLTVAQGKIEIDASKVLNAAKASGVAATGAVTIKADGSKMGLYVGTKKIATSNESIAEVSGTANTAGSAVFTFGSIGKITFTATATVATSALAGVTINVGPTISKSGGTDAVQAQVSGSGTELLAQLGSLTADASITLQYSGGSWTIKAGAKTITAKATVSNGDLVLKAGSSASAAIYATISLGTSTATAGDYQTAFGAAKKIGLYTAATSGGSDVKASTVLGSKATAVASDIRSASTASDVKTILTSNNLTEVASKATTGKASSAVPAVASIDWLASAAATIAASKATGATGTVTLTVGGKNITFTIASVASAVTTTGGTMKVSDLKQAILDRIQKEANEATASQVAANATTVYVYSNFRFENDTNGPVSHTLNNANGITWDVTAYSNVPTQNNTTPPKDGVIDYQFQTTAVKHVELDGGDRYASTYIDVGDIMDKVADGNEMTIGKDTYTFTTDKSKADTDGYVFIGEDGKAGAATVARRLSYAARNNSTYSVGYDGTCISFAEITTQSNFVDDKGNSTLTSKEAIADSIGFTTGKIKGEKNGGLRLQIGDTADSYNQLVVNIDDMHTAALGIADIDISNQQKAAEAIDKIKAAINQVSDVRGTLGATQNRLDHTMNNLSVMTENIQDAESTIRDTDVADEMMAYTKNNILIQSAQAMLAQANQVPQGVLQLLQ